MRIHLFILGGGIALTIASGMFSVACATPNIPGEDAPAADPSGNAPGTETKTPTGAYKRDGGASAAQGSPGAGTGGGTGAGTGGGTGTGTGTMPKPAPTTQADAAPPAMTNACATSANQNTCYTCCENQVPSAVPFLDNEWGKCQCEVPGACAQACGNEYCAGFAVQPGGACDSCLAANNSACNTKADNACAADATCNKLFACADNSGCSAKQ